MLFSVAIILAVVQALTEFLPVSSSGHLVVFQTFFESFFSISKTPLAFDIFVHFASLLAVLVFLRKEIIYILSGLFSANCKQVIRGIVLPIIIGSIPAIVLGLSLMKLGEDLFFNIEVACFGFLITSLMLELAHRVSLRNSNVTFENFDIKKTEVGLRDAFLVGCAQALAILPGVSRSGSTISTGLLLGMNPQLAIKFSFLLSIPVIFGANLLKVDQLFLLTSGDLLVYLTAFVVTAFCSWFALKWLVKIVELSRLRYFAIYTLFLSIFIFISLKLYL